MVVYMQRGSGGDSGPSQLGEVYLSVVPSLPVQLGAPCAGRETIRSVTMVALVRWLQIQIQIQIHTCAAGLHTSWKLTHRSATIVTIDGRYVLWCLERKSVVIGESCENWKVFPPPPAKVVHGPASLVCWLVENHHVVPQSDLCNMFKVKVKSEERRLYKWRKW